MYENIIFNTNPIIYEDWDEFINRTGSNELIMYRFIENEGIYFRIIDAQDKGNILGSFLIPVNFKSSSESNYPVSELFNNVKSKMNQSINFNLIENNKIMLIDGDKHSIDSEQYKENFKKYNEMQFAIEEGILSSIISKNKLYDLKVKEKLKTLYLKKTWMYQDKVFNLNPIYLNDWSQLKEFDVDIIFVYNNLIPYHQISKNSSENYEIAISYKLINVKTGDIIQVGEISN